MKNFVVNRSLKNFRDRILSFFLLASYPLMADKAFEIDPQEYKYLDQLGWLYTDKSSWGHNYTEIYSYYFHAIKDKPLKFLEIGIFEGGSVQLWEQYFKNAELHFIDVTLDGVRYSSTRSHYHIVDQANVEQLQNFVNTTGGKFDIILDDGGHTMEQQITSFTTLFPHLNRGGLYIIEDLHTSYWPGYGGEEMVTETRTAIKTTVQFLKSLVDEVNFVGRKTGRANHRRDLSQIRDELTPYREQILGIHFYDSLCIVIKR